MWLSACLTCDRAWCDSQVHGGDRRQQLREAACQCPSQDLPANAGSIETAELEPGPAIGTLALAGPQAPN